MPLLSSATVLRLVDSMAIVLSQAYQLARARLASVGSPILRPLRPFGRSTQLALSATLTSVAGVGFEPTTSGL